jgi:diguanylate cyclase (GGDEF)-like protein
VEELLLWRWSTGIQTLSVLLITVFLSFSGRREGGEVLSDWARAWQWNCVALGVTWFYWLAQPEALGLLIARVTYATAKTAFLLYLLAGVLRFTSQADRSRLPGQPWMLAAAYGLLGGLWLDSVPAIGMTQSALIAVACTTGAVLSLGGRGLSLEWLALGFGLRAVFGALEAWAYGSLVLGVDRVPGELLSLFVAGHSSLDLVAEWTIALGCMLALASRAQRELRASQQALRAQAERDALTGLRNRHGLEDVLHRAQREGACLLFFDLDDFKRINDEAGHAAGDHCLSAVAAALRRHFREDDEILRFAGDEFLVISHLRDPDAIEARVQAMAEDLAALPEPCPIHFSVGAAWLEPGGDPMDALRRADQAMYSHKAERRQAA